LQRSGLLSPLKERDFARLWTGQVVSDAGEWVNYVALTSLVWDMTGSAWMLAVLRACHAVPLLVLGPFAGVFVDRWNRKTTMVVVDILRAGMVALFPFAHDIATILAITLAFNTVSVFFTPAKNSIIPQIVSPDRLLPANSLSSTTRNMAQVVGPAVGGFILTIGGTAAAFYFNSATFLFAGVAILSMQAPGVRARGTREGVSATQELREGFRFASSRPPVRSALLLEIGLALGWGSVNVLAIVIAEQMLGGGPTEYGLLLTSMGLGSVAGAIVIGWAGGRMGVGNILMAGFLLMGVFTAGLASSPVVLTAAASYFLIAVGRAFIDVTATTIYQRSVPDSLLGRIFALRYMTTHLMLLISNQIAGLFTDAASLVPLFVAAAALEILCALSSRLLVSAFSQRVFQR